MTAQILDPAAQGDGFDPLTIVWVLDEARVQALLDHLPTCTEVVIDLETTGLDEHATGRGDHPVAARVSMASLTLPQMANPMDPRPPTFVVPLSHPEGPWAGQWRVLFGRILRAIRSTRKPITNHNLKFDLKWGQATTGVDLSGQFAWDTQISSHLLDENSSTKLKERAPDSFGVGRWDDHDLSTPGAAEKVPLYELGVYAARDTYWTWRLAVLHRTLMAAGAEGEDADPPYGAEEAQDYQLGVLASWCAMPTSQTLTQIEMRGLRMDPVWVRAKVAEEEELETASFDSLIDHYDLKAIPHQHVAEDTDWEADCRTCRLAGDVSFAPTSLWFRAWTQWAVEQGDLRVASLTPNGAPQWSKSVLTRQAATGSAVARLLLDFRQANKRLEFLRSWLALVTPEETVHTTYNAGRVVTGRLSSNTPNVQQITYALKPAFLARPGYLMAEFDYSQIELRIGAQVSGCEAMLEAYHQGQDLHRMLASRVSGVPLEDVTKDQRQEGKAGNFGFLYGMSASGFKEYALTAYGVVFSDEEAEEVRAMFFSQWDGIAAWHQRAINTARTTGQVVSPIGRVRRLPNIWDGNERLVGEAERQAINSPVQGFASDLMQMAGASILGNLPGHTRVPDVHLVGTVHDSIVAEVPEDDWQRASARCMRRMLDLAPVLKRLGCTLDVPLQVEATVGTRWGLGDVGIIK